MKSASGGGGGEWWWWGGGVLLLPHIYVAGQLWSAGHFCWSIDPSTGHTGEIKYYLCISASTGEYW